MTISMATMLKERLDRNMRDFKADLSDYDTGTIFGMAHTIAAMEDTYRLMVTVYEFDSDEARYLLKFANPLEILADEWASILHEPDADFASVLCDFFENDDNEDIYPLESEMYGFNIDLEEFDFEEFDCEDMDDAEPEPSFNELLTTFLDVGVAVLKAAAKRETM